jgi:hypothetical protein
MKAKPNVEEEVEQSPNVELLTYTVPAAGAKAGLTHSGSYEAAKRGEIPTIRFGKLLRVPKAKWDRILLGD